jgi:hypothetical protein
MADPKGKIGQPFKKGLDQVKQFFTQNEFDVLHDISVPPLGREVGILPSKIEGEPIKIVLTTSMIAKSLEPGAKSFHGGDPYTRRVEKKNGETFGVNFKATKGCYELVESGGSGKPVAVCLKDSSERIVICGFQPLYPGQEPTVDKRYDRPIYAYYFFKQRNDNMYASYKVAVVNEKGNAAYDIHQGAKGLGLRIQEHIVRFHEKPCALIEYPKDKDFSGRRGAYHITVNPGIDPCLIIFLSILCVFMDKQEEEGNLFERFGREIIA